MTSAAGVKTATSYFSCGYRIGGTERLAIARLGDAVFLVRGLVNIDELRFIRVTFASDES
jgi:hypothetical protein